MKRIPLILALLVGGYLLTGAGCSSDPNVEGAKLDLRNKDYDRALQNLETALQKNPSNAEALELKGRVLAEQMAAIEDPQERADMVGQMIDAYDKAQAADPTMAETIKRNKQMAYVNEFQKAVQTFNRGQNDASQFASAALLFENVSKIMPDSASPYVNRGFALIRAGRSAEAIGPFTMALEKGETDVDIYRYLASLYIQEKRAAEAIPVLEKARTTYPDNADIQAELLNAYQESGQMDQAMALYKGEVERDPNNKLYQYNYGSLLLQAERYDDAIVHLQRATEIDAQYANAWYNLGAAYTNKAVVVNEQITAKDDELRASRARLTQAQIQEREREIDNLAAERTRMFEQSIGPLEKARDLFQAANQETQAVCQTLYRAYVQTRQQDKANAVSECAGFSQN
jgi:tetratricopeptide (TPR) repeat protein